tara:strand:- start:892 stop:1395 length:504 start_codon:yes stop_codon:yes gene_type:complete
MDTRKDKWNINKISNSCYKSNDLFDDNETVISELVFENGILERRDYKYQCFNANNQSLSSWKTIFKLPKPKEEIIKKDSIEDLLRKKISLESNDSINIIFILAIMLERKKILIEKSFFFDDDNKKIRIYEHKKTNESFTIIDPQLSLNEIEPLKAEVYDLIKLTQNN